MAQWPITWQINGGSIAAPKCKPCAHRKSHSQGSIKLFLFDTFRVCLFKKIIFFLSFFLSAFFFVPFMFWIWWGSCNRTQEGQNKMRKEADGATQMWDKKCNSKQTLFSTVVTHEKHEKDGSIQEGHDLTRGLLIGRVCTGARDTHHILLSLSLHLYQPLSPPSPLFVTLLSSLALSLHPCVSPLSATFIYSSQLSVHSIPPQSSTTFPPLIHKNISLSMLTKAETH